MLKISNLLAQAIYEGPHPITGKDIKQKWSEFSQDDLYAILEAHPSNFYIFDSNSDFIRPEPTTKTKQADNVNTTAQSTTRANDTVTTTAKGTLS